MIFFLNPPVKKIKGDVRQFQNSEYKNTFLNTNLILSYVYVR